MNQAWLGSAVRDPNVYLTGDQSIHVAGRSAVREKFSARFNVLQNAAVKHVELERRGRAA